MRAPQFAATNTSDGNGGIFQDVPARINVGDTFCGSAQVATQGGGSGAAGTFAVWLLAVPAATKRPTRPLPTCPVATPGHRCRPASPRPAPTRIRIQFYVDPEQRQTLTHRQRRRTRQPGCQWWVQSGFWVVAGDAEDATTSPTVLLSTGNDPYEGTQFAATNTSDGNGGIFQDVPARINVGDTFCGSAQVATQGGGSGAGGTFVVWLLAVPAATRRPTRLLPTCPVVTRGHRCRPASPRPVPTRHSHPVLRRPRTTAKPYHRQRRRALI